MPKPEKPQEPAGLPDMARPRPRWTAASYMRWVEGLLALVMIAVVAVMLFPVFAGGREKARTSSCMNNLEQIATAMLMFAKDNDDRLPDAQRWEEQLLPYTKNKQVYRCTNVSASAKRSYAMNPRCSGAKFESFTDPPSTIVFYDADEAGRPDPRHDGLLNCAYLDGHVKSVKGVPDELSSTTYVAPPTQNYGLVDKLKLAYQASAEVWVRSVHQAVLEAEKTVAERGGFVLSSVLTAQQEPYTGQITCRVPTQEVANTINALGNLGWVARREITGEDLTPKYLQKTQEVATADKREERLAKVVTAAPGNKPAVDSETALAETEKGEDTARGELYQVADRTTLATISATLLQRERPTPAEAPTIGASWRGALEALKGVGVALARMGIWLALFAWLWLPPVWVMWRVHRRRKPGA